jgi:nitrite reductase (NADH) small subunit
MTRACSIEDVPCGEGRAVTVNGKRIALFRAASGWFALDAICPHKGGPLADGILADTTVTCPLHDRRFALADGASLDDGCDSVQSYAVRVSGDTVHVEL